MNEETEINETNVTFAGLSDRPKNQDIEDSP